MRIYEVRNRWRTNRITQYGGEPVLYCELQVCSATVPAVITAVGCRVWVQTSNILVCMYVAAGKQHTAHSFITLPTFLKAYISKSRPVNKRAMSSQVSHN